MQDIKGLNFRGLGPYFLQRTERKFHPPKEKAAVDANPQLYLKMLVYDRLGVAVDPVDMCDRNRQISRLQLKEKYIPDDKAKPKLQRLPADNRHRVPPRHRPLHPILLIILFPLPMPMIGQLKRAACIVTGIDLIEG